jgi:hypothetical protein
MFCKRVCTTHPYPYWPGLLFLLKVCPEALACGLGVVPHSAENQIRERQQLANGFEKASLSSLISAGRNVQVPVKYHSLPLKGTVSTPTIACSRFNIDLFHTPKWAVQCRL